MRKAAILISIIIFAGLLYWFFVGKDGETPKVATDFDSCVALGNPILESYPEQCIANGETFVRDIGNELEKSDLIRTIHPRPGEKITSPLEITGEARGYWFFEASFPFELIDGEGALVAQGVATAGGEWMTEEFVPFTATLTFEKPTTLAGTLILKKDNPSGLPEHDDALIVPIKF